MADTKRADEAPVASRETSLALAVAVLAAVAAISGLVAPQLYRDPALIREGWIANDAVTLLLALPVLVASARRARRGSMRARLVMIGATHYVLYDYGFYLFGATLNALLLVYASIVAVSAWALVLAMSRTDVAALAAAFHAPPARKVAGWMMFVSVGLSVVWTAQWLVALLRATPPERFDLTPEFIRVVAGLDLTLMVSILVPGALLLWRRRPWGLLLGTAMNVSGALYNVVLAAGTVAQIRAGLPGAWPMFALWIGLGLGCFACSAGMLAAVPAASSARPAA
jgi:hypothetical protein